MTNPEPCPWQGVCDLDFHSLDVYADETHIYFLQTAAPEWDRIHDTEPDQCWIIQIWRRPVTNPDPVEHLLARSYQAGENPSQAFKAWCEGIEDTRGLSAVEVKALFAFTEPEWLEESFEEVDNDA